MSRTSTSGRSLMAGMAALTGIGVFALAGSGCGNRMPDLSTPYTYVTMTGETRSVARRDLAGTPLEFAWDVQLRHPVLRSWINPNLPHLVYFQEYQTNAITAFDALSGAPKWISPEFGRPPKVESTSSHDLVSGTGATAIYDDRSWTIADDTLFSFDAEFGQLVWRYDLDFSPSTGPLAIGAQGNQRVFLGGWDERLHVVTYLPEKHLSHELWQVNLHAPVLAPLVYADGLVYVGDQGGAVHCFKLDRGQGAVWRKETGASVGGLVARDRVVFAANEYNQIHAFNRLSGDPLGTLFVNGPVRKPPMVFNGEPDRLYAFVDHADPAIGGLVCVRTQLDTLSVTQPDAAATVKRFEIMRMETQWRIPGVSRLVGSTPLHLFVTNDQNPSEVVAINRRFGRVDWAWDTTRDHQAEGVLGDGAVVDAGSK